MPSLFSYWGQRSEGTIKWGRGWRNSYDVAEKNISTSGGGKCINSSVVSMPALQQSVLRSIHAGTTYLMPPRGSRSGISKVQIIFIIIKLYISNTSQPQNFFRTEQCPNKYCLTAKSVYQVWPSGSFDYVRNDPQRSRTEQLGQLGLG